VILNQIIVTATLNYKIKTSVHVQLTKDVCVKKEGAEA